VAPKLPDRYEMRIRLGRDGDVTEWLATDTSLDRPVLVRVLEPGAGDKRKREFIEAARAAASAHHVGLAEVYAMGTEQNPYAILEWHGGVSLADRLRAGETVTVAEFLSIGPRLASGLAALHETGAVHGAIDVGAIGFSGGSPAKLGAFGRRARDFTRREDTAALAAALRIAVTGSDIAGIRPSEVAEGLPDIVDSALADAELGRLGASSLAAALRSQHPPRERPKRSGWSWKWSWVSAALVVLALIISAAGVAIEVDPESPFLYPAVPADSAAPPPVLGDARPPGASDALTAEASGYDPSGDAFPNVDDLALVLDAARSTAWRTDTYAGPLSAVKPGIGIVFTVAGSPRFMEVVATPGTGFDVLWSGSGAIDDAAWEKVFSGTALDGPSNIRLPQRDSGGWLLWITRLPERDDARFYSDINAVAFIP
jgi:hypothetical protein